MSRKTYPPYLRLVGSEEEEAKREPESVLYPNFAISDSSRRSYPEGRWLTILFRHFMPSRYRLRFDGGCSTVYDAWEGRPVFMGWGVGAQERAERYFNRRNFCWRLDLQFYWSDKE